MEKTKKLQLEDFTENEFFGTQEQRFCCKVFQKIYFSVKLRKKTERTE